MNDGVVLVIDDEKTLSEMLGRILTFHGYRTFFAYSAKEGIETAKKILPDIILLDLKLPDLDGIELMKALLDLNSSFRIIIITANASVKSAVKTTQMGALDYIEKPFEPDRLLLSIRNALVEKALEDEVNIYRHNATSLNRMSGKSAVPSESMKKVYDIAQKAANSDGAILITGETGSGKDFLANWIHSHSLRKNGPYFSLNCSAISKTLAESELFGYEPGAFTGSSGRKRGLLEIAAGGTLLLNEIGEMDLQTQAKLLTFLDTKSFLRVGGDKPVKVDTRIISATNLDLMKEVKEGNFRQDLYYRLNILQIHLPPLRKRKEDIPVIAMQIINNIEMSLPHKKVVSITTQAMDTLMKYQWPGNIRELRNALERALMLSDDGIIKSDDLVFLNPANQTTRLSLTMPDELPLDEMVANFERDVIVKALESTNTRNAAAKKLGITRHSLTHRIKKLGIEPDA